MRFRSSNTVPPPPFISSICKVLGGCHVRGSFLDRLPFLASASAFPVVTNLPLGSIGSIAMTRP